MNAIEIHTLTTYGPSYLNGDRFGNQKTSTVNGMPRHRISSASSKYMYRKNMTMMADGIHTRYMPYDVTAKIKSKHPEWFGEEGSEDLLKISLATLAATVKDDASKGKKKKDKNDDKKTNQCLAYSYKELETIAEKVTAELEKLNGDIKKFSKEIEKNAFKTALEASILNARTSIGRNIALFGRMSTTAIMDSIESAFSMNHSFATHTYMNETDFFIAVEEYVEREDDGAAMLGEQDINSSCMYKYISVDMDTLYRNLLYNIEDTPQNRKEAAEAAKEIVAELLKVIITIHPAAKQHSMAAKPAPHMMYINIISDGQCVTLEKAFAKAISGGNIARKSVEAFADKVIDRTWDFQKHLLETVILDADMRDIDFGKGVKLSESAHSAISDVSETIDTLMREKLE